MIINYFRKRLVHFQRRYQSRYRIEILRTSLEFLRQGSISGTAESDSFYHFTATHVWRHLIQPLSLSIQNTCSRSRIDFMPGESIKITVQRPHIHLLVDNTLGTVNQYGNSFGMTDTDDFLYRIYNTEHIGNMRHRHKLCPGCKQLRQLVQVQFTVFLYVKYLKHRFFSLTKHLPGNNIGVMLSCGNHNFIAFLYKSFTEGKSHQINAGGGSIGKNNLFPGRCIQVFCNKIAGTFIRLGGNSG